MIAVCQGKEKTARTWVSARIGKKIPVRDFDTPWYNK
jgi:hypothetical protein